MGIGKRNISLGWPTLLHANHLCDILVKCTGGEFRLQKNRRISSGTCYAKWLCNKPLPQLHRRLHWFRTQGIAVISFDKVQGTGFKAWIASPFSLSPFFFFFFFDPLTIQCVLMTINKVRRSSSRGNSEVYWLKLWIIIRPRKKGASPSDLVHLHA